MSNFRVGQKVVCVDEAGQDDVQADEVYEVRWVGIFHQPEWNIGPALAVRLVGITRPDFTHDDIPLRATRFRPVVEPGTETGMRILRDLLNKADESIEVGA